MKIIGIETSGMKGGIALIDSDKNRLKEFRFTKGMVHGRYLIPAIQKGLKQLKWRISDIDLVAVDIGPGSYTGLRVGLATAKTLVYALNEQRKAKKIKPKVALTGITSLDAMVQNIHDSYEYICPIIDARWNQVYTAIYKDNKGQYKKTSRYLAVTPEELIKQLPSNVFMFGDGLVRYKDVFTSLPGRQTGKGITFGRETQWFPRARHIARLGLDAFKKGKKTDPVSLIPLYLRPTEAEVKRKGKR